MSSYIERMRMGQKIVIPVVLLIAAALGGLLLIQISMLNHAVRLESETFRQNVHAALSSVVQKLETRDMLVKILEVSEGRTEGIDEQRMKVIVETGGRKRNEDSEAWGSDLPYRIAAHIDSNMVSFVLKKPHRIRLVLLDSLGQEKSEVMNAVKEVGEHEIPLPASSSSEGEIHIKLFIDSTAYEMHFREGPPRDVTISCDPVSDVQRSALARRVLEESTTFIPKHIEDRIKPVILDSLVRATLVENGIRMDAAYGIVSAVKDSIILANPEQHGGDLLRSDYRTRLFPHDVFVESNDLVLYFPGERIALVKRLGLSVISSLFFIAVIVFCFVFIVRTVFQQRRFSDLLVGFINNMTHEFKTPISTISLASETLMKPEIRGDENRLKKYGRIIRDESTRMRTQVEKILEMAALEKGDFELRMGEVDVHDLIRKAVENFRLQVEKRDGRLSTDLGARSHIVKGEVVHLSNVIHNLLDNAVKYTREDPEVVVTTRNNGHLFEMTVEDNGLGIPPEAQKRVFDKYYRVPTGNVHDVKGFGLGLSYVKLMVEAHGGTVGVKSDLNKGSVFKITLPIDEADA
ncbi:MAG: HAMP domain-containing sensor histidine kinase [bacterium]